MSPPTNPVRFKDVDVCDVGMVQRGEDLGLALETSDPFRIVGKRVRQNLQRYVALEARVPRAVDLSHSTRTDGSHHFVGPETSAGTERHGK